MIERKDIKPGTRLVFTISPRERDLIVERAFLEPEIEARFRAATVQGRKLVVNLTLDDLDDLHGCVAAEANHTGDAKVRRVLDAVCDRLGALEARFTDEIPATGATRRRSAPKFTLRQGQYLAFIYWYIKIQGRAPAEADLQKFFKVSPPSVHAMVLALERRGLIHRTPGKARSVVLRVSRAELPELE
jgi:repressor LexA